MTALTHKPENSEEQDMELRARCPQWMKDGVQVLAEARLLSEADILREAVTEYLDRRKSKMQRRAA